MLLARDRDRLRGVHPDLIQMVEKAREKVTFFVGEGLRSRARQAELLAQGFTRTMNSRHLTGHAVDLIPWTDKDQDGQVDQDEIDWRDGRSFKAVADAMKEAAAELGLQVEWGGDWKSFYDGPHFQLPWAAYP